MYRFLCGGGVIKCHDKEQLRDEGVFLGVMVLERDGGGRKGTENNRHMGRHGNRLLEQGTERSPLQL